jgi:glycerol-3-phosphate acyltransferase PlsY
VATLFARTDAARAARSPRGAPWLTVVVLAVLLAYADGFWLVSLQGAIGAIERTDHPFVSWLEESTAVFPVFVVAVLGALTLARRRLGPEPHRPREVVSAALLVVLAGTAVGMLAIVTSAAYDFHLQSAQLHLTHALSALHGHCDDTCLAREEHNTFAVQVRGVLLVSRWVLLTNVVLVAWAVALMGGRIRLGSPRVRTTGRWPRA